MLRGCLGLCWLLWYRKFFCVHGACRGQILSLRHLLLADECADAARIGVKVFLLVIYWRLSRENACESNNGRGMSADQDTLDIVSLTIGQDAFHGVGYTFMQLRNRFTAGRGQDRGGEVKEEIRKEGLEKGGRGRAWVVESCGPIPFPR